MPVFGYFTFPLSSNCCAILRTSLIGIAKAMPSTFSISIFKETIPISLPSLSTTAPPELPGFTEMIYIITTILSISTGT